jgi:hypothetical protein
VLALQQQASGTPQQGYRAQQQQQQQQQEAVSPLVQRGLILNPSTGKTIKIGGAKYNEMVLAGFSPDASKGVLVEPGNGSAVAGSRSAAALRQLQGAAPSETTSSSVGTRRSGRQR